MVEAIASLVMIIGLNSDFTYLMQYYARKSGRQAVVASPDKGVLTLAKREKPGVIILEADRADAVSWDVLQDLKADQATHHIPVVVCSWLGEETNELAKDTAYYLQKPVLYDDFLTALSDVGQRSDQKGGDERLKASPSEVPQGH